MKKRIVRAVLYLFFSVLSPFLFCKKIFAQRGATSRVVDSTADNLGALRPIGAYSGTANLLSYADKSEVMLWNSIQYDAKTKYDQLEQAVSKEGRPIMTDAVKPQGKVMMREKNEASMRSVSHRGVSHLGGGNTSSAPSTSSTGSAVSTAWWRKPAGSLENLSTSQQPRAEKVVFDNSKTNELATKQGDRPWYLASAKNADERPETAPESPNRKPTR